ncbi:hypothetical protein NVP1115B_08 [Vibrio phage 1.115.B._10N.222.49.B11]|nr:hypothetical protein NVP1115A_08 [Vibrio phage 1.115.A._10N.222.49.B11]AUR88554.1 hypothetical protein NVP1115B_08 [Vibrio phage 1.115.B._10N.222.49.B11]
MSIRNELLIQVLEAYGGTASSNSRNGILQGILSAIGGPTIAGATRNQLLFSICLELGGSPSIASSRNELLRCIVLASGGTITNPNIRNSLIADWVNSAEARVNLYPNPLLEGAGQGDIVQDVPSGALPTSHTLTTFSSSPTDATYNTTEPVYTFNPAGLNDCRLAMSTLNLTGLPLGRIYRFQAEVRITNWQGVVTQELRGVNVNAIAGGDSIDNSNADHSGTNGAWELVWWDFYITSDQAQQAQLRHGIGLIASTSGLTQETRNLALYDIGELRDFNSNDFNEDDFA